MFHYAFKKKYLKQWIAYYSLLCLLLTSQVPSKIFADEPYVDEPCSFVNEPCSCVLIDPEAARRTRVATVVAGATVIALVGGVAYAVFGSSGHKHHHSSHHHSSCHSYGYDSSCRSTYSDSSSDDCSSHHSQHSHHSHHSHQSHHSHSSPWYSDYSPSHYYSCNPNSIFSENNVSSFGSDPAIVADPQFLERGNLPLRGRRLGRTKASKESSELSGVFVIHPTLSESHQGSITAFVRLPDGSTQTLGSLPFSSRTGSSIPYGPFTEKGTYTFGIRIEEATSLPSKVGSLEANVNGSTVESYDFFVPVHPPAHYEPHPFEYTLS